MAGNWNWNRDAAANFFGAKFKLRENKFKECGKWFCMKLQSNGQTKNGELKVEKLYPVWPDGKVTYLAIIEKLPNSIQTFKLGTLLCPIQHKPY